MIRGMGIPKRPTVLVNGEMDTSEKRRLQLPMRYTEALWHAGATPLVMPAFMDRETRGAAELVAKLLDEADALVLSGGDDFDTERLGQGATHPAANPVPNEKQDFDLLLGRAALERDLPILGICYGMQLLGIEGGGRLHQHLPDDRPGGADHTGGVVHPVDLAPESKLRGIFGVERIDVISRHHQALAAVPAPWIVTAHDSEGLIEAIEHASATWAVGVQWHPELDAFDGPQARLFASLVEAARERAHHRTLSL